MSRALGSAALAVLVVGAAVAYALRLPEAGESMRLRLGLVLPYIVLASIAIWRMRRGDRWRELVTFRPGDPSMGILLGVLLVVAAWAFAQFLFPPEALQHAWLLRVFLLAGDTSTPFALFWLLLLAVTEELVWRGWIQTELSGQFGARRGWVLGAVCYAVAFAPTLATLSDAAAGPNPIVVLAALGCGLCWAFLRERTGRVLPSVLSHAAFSYLASQFLWRFI
jgi:uncharacterized protein